MKCTQLEFLPLFVSQINLGCAVSVSSVVYYEMEFFIFLQTKKKMYLDIHRYIHVYPHFPFKLS